MEVSGYIDRLWARYRYLKKKKRSVRDKLAKLKVNFGLDHHIRKTMSTYLIILLKMV